jgi:hypothetical protein
MNLGRVLKNGVSYTFSGEEYKWRGKFPLNNSHSH